MTLRRLTTALPLLLAAAPAPPFAPGLWQEQMQVTLDTVNGSAERAAAMGARMRPPAPRRQCYSAAEIGDGRGLLLDGGDGRCRFDRFALAAGRVSATGECQAGVQRMRVAGEGRVTPQGYDFAFTGAAEVNGAALRFHGRDTGRRVADCSPLG